MKVCNWVMQVPVNNDLYKCMKVYDRVVQMSVNSVLYECVKLWQLDCAGACKQCTL